MSIENFKVKMMWTCDTCDKTIQHSSKSAHLKSKTHQKKAGNTPTKECDLCCTTSFDFKHCSQCVHSWCVDCHKKMDKCPFCRKSFPDTRCVSNSFYVVSFDLEELDDPWEPVGNPIDNFYVERFGQPGLQLEDVLELEHHFHWLNSTFA